MGLTSPCDTVPKITGLPRWQRNWINAHRSINYSGLVQEMLNKIIANQDPEYFMKNKLNMEKRFTKRKENTMIAIAIL